MHIFFLGEKTSWLLCTHCPFSNMWKIQLLFCLLTLLFYSGIGYFLNFSYTYTITKTNFKVCMSAKHNIANAIMCTQINSNTTNIKDFFSIFIINSNEFNPYN